MVGIGLCYLGAVAEQGGILAEELAAELAAEKEQATRTGLCILPRECSELSTQSIAETEPPTLQSAFDPSDNLPDKAKTARTKANDHTKAPGPMQDDTQRESSSPDTWNGIYDRPPADLRVHRPAPNEAFTPSLYHSTQHREGHWGDTRFSPAVNHHSGGPEGLEEPTSPNMVWGTGVEPFLSADGHHATPSVEDWNGGFHRPPDESDFEGIKVLSNANQHLFFAPGNPHTPYYVVDNSWDQSGASVPPSQGMYDRLNAMLYLGTRIDEPARRQTRPYLVIRSQVRPLTKTRAQLYTALDIPCLHWEPPLLPAPYSKTWDSRVGSLNCHSSIAGPRGLLFPKPTGSTTPRCWFRLFGVEELHSVLETSTYPTPFGPRTYHPGPAHFKATLQRVDRPPACRRLYLT